MFALFGIRFARWAEHVPDFVIFGAQCGCSHTYACVCVLVCKATCCCCSGVLVSPYTCFRKALCLHVCVCVRLKVRVTLRFRRLLAFGACCRCWWLPCFCSVSFFFFYISPVTFLYFTFYLENLALTPSSMALRRILYASAAHCLFAVACCCSVFVVAVTMLLRLAAVKIFEYSFTANAVQKFMQIFHSLGFLPPSLPLCSLFGNSCLLFSPAWLLLLFCLLVIFVALVFNLKFDLWMIICNDMRKWAGNMRSTHTHINNCIIRVFFATYDCIFS